MEPYRVKFEVFEGPLDLLLYLIKKQEVDIYQVNLSELATQFIEYIDMMRMLDIEVAGEFLVMAATLLYIKSRELLPVNQQAVDEEDLDDFSQDPKWELIQKLIEYKKFKEAAAELQKLEILQENIYSRPESKAKCIPAQPNTPIPIQASIFDLLSAFNAVLKRFQARIHDSQVIEEDYSVTDKIEHILLKLKTSPLIFFSELFKHTRSRVEAVVTFLALLELIRTGHARALQKEPFGEIEIHRGPALDHVTPDFTTISQTLETQNTNE